MTPEDMKESFGPVGTVGTVQSTDNKTINDKLDQIIAGINEINSKIVTNPEVTETPQIVEEVPAVEEAPVAEPAAEEINEETIEPETKSFTAELDEVVKELNEKKQTNVEPVKEVVNDIGTTQDFSNEIDSIIKELEKQSAPAAEENTFTPVNVDTLPAVEEPKVENNFVDINTLLSENTEQPVVEQPVAPVQAPEAATPIVPEQPAVAPAPVQTEVTPVIEQPVAPIAPMAEQSKGYSVVKDEYVGMTIPGNEIKTDGSPQRVMAVSSNEKIQGKTAEKTLVMSNAA